MRSLHDMYGAVDDDGRRIICELRRWHGNEWSLAEDRWRQYVRAISEAREMDKYEPREVLRRAEITALSFIGTLLLLPGCLCPFCQRIYQPDTPPGGDDG